MRDLFVIDRELLVAVSGGLTSNVRAKPAEKEAKPLTLPGAATQPPIAPPQVLAQPPQPPPDPMAGMLGQMLQQRMQG